MIFRLDEFVELIAVQYKLNGKRSFLGDVSWGFLTMLRGNQGINPN